VNLKDKVFAALENALANGYNMRADPVDSVCVDLCTYDADLEDYDPGELRVHVTEWQMEKKHMQTLDLTTPDTDGYIPDLRLFGSKWRHAGNGLTYEITGFVFFGDEDRWAVIHRRDGAPVMFSRTVRNFFGQRGNEPRYTVVNKVPR